MDMFDEAMAIRSTMQLCHLTQSELAKQLGVSQSYVANKLRLLKFSKEMTERIRKSGISERHARSLLRFDREEDALRALDAVCEGQMTVRECEAMVDAEIIRQLPESLGGADKLDTIADFGNMLRRACEHLRSRGLEVRTRTSYLEGDMYITVIVKDA